MAKVKDATALLVMAVQDLYDGEVAMVERLPKVCEQLRDAELRRIVERDQTDSAVQRDVLAGIARKLEAKPDESRNIWLRAILDDADNDARTIAPGVFLDIALTGALRKGKQSERVSYETAIGLAARLGMDDAAAELTAIRDAEEARDAALAAVLGRLCTAA